MLMHSFTAQQLMLSKALRSTSGTVYEATFGGSPAAVKLYHDKGAHLQAELAAYSMLSECTGTPGVLSLSLSHTHTHTRCSLLPFL